MKQSLSPGAKLVGFAVVLAVVLAGSFGLARVVASGAGSDRGSGESHSNTTMDPNMRMDLAEPVDHGGDKAAAMPAAVLPGLSVAQSGYRLAAESTVVALGPAQPFRFRLLGPDGRPVQQYDQLHGRDLHLIVVRRDLTGYQHLHPVRDPDGTWAAAINLPTGGTWRAFADFEPTGGPGQLTLGVDLQVTGTFEAGTGPTAATVPDPLVTVHLDRRGDTIEAAVLRNGIPVQPEPYLGARGHLVALRAGDLAYLHVHPEAGDGQPVRFGATMPTAGTYALFFDYQVDGVVRTATATTEVK